MIDDSRGKKKRRHITAFYIETLILVAVFTVVILILTKVFALSGQLGAKAGILTGAVHLAENGAEAVAASESLEEVRRLLEENGNAEILVQAGPEGAETASKDSAEGLRILRMQYDEGWNPVSEGSIWMDIQWLPEEPGDGSEGGGLVRSIITVGQIGREEPVYTLETAVYIGK